jgi:hypothetical protein
MNTYNFTDFCTLYSDTWLAFALLLKLGRAHTHYCSTCKKHRQSYQINNYVHPFCRSIHSGNSRVKGVLHEDVDKLPELFIILLLSIQTEITPKLLQNYLGIEYVTARRFMTLLPTVITYQKHPF